MIEAESTVLLGNVRADQTEFSSFTDEFAREFPRIAARLGMEGMEVTDPYVERLLEGFAFLAARIQLKLDAEQPRLIAHLLESTYPNFLAPMPSMMVAPAPWPWMFTGPVTSKSPVALPSSSESASAIL